MSRFPLVTDPDDDRVEALYRQFVDAGFGETTPISWFTAQAIRPDILEATWSLVKGVLVEGRLPATIKQLIAMTISVANDCRYCTVTHTNALRSMGVPDDVIEACATDPTTADLPEPHRELLAFAVRVAREPNAVTDDDFAQLRRLGLDDAEIMEVVMMAAFTNFINTWADAAGIAVDGATSEPSPNGEGSERGGPPAG